MAAHTQTAARLKTLNPEGTVFAEFTALANEHKAVNLGQVRKAPPRRPCLLAVSQADGRSNDARAGLAIQGFPNIEAPKFIKDAAAAAVTGPFYLNQYTRSLGHPRLVQGTCRPARWSPTPRCPHAHDNPCGDRVRRPTQRWRPTTRMPTAGRSTR